MNLEERCRDLRERFVAEGDHERSDYFSLVRELLKCREKEGDFADRTIKDTYQLVLDEIKTRTGTPRSRIKFGTSGWRGILGKDVYVSSVRAVTRAIIRLYETIETDPGLKEHLGVSSLSEAKARGCLVGFDNRFAGDVLGTAVAEVLVAKGFKVYFCGETTTGVLSAALLELKAAFSVNLTPSHNPLDYGGYKYNAADAGPAASELTTLITEFARQAVETGDDVQAEEGRSPGEITELDSFSLWQQLVDRNKNTHGIDYRELLKTATEHTDLLIVVDPVHGAGRLHVKRLLEPASANLVVLRGEPDVTFGGIAPEPSSENMRQVTQALEGSEKKLKIGAIIDPDADRIRFTDGTTEISMNQFGAMAYHFLHELKGKRGMVAKTVATSNLANAVALKLGEKVYETKVGFKEFKPVIGRALVCFEESDGISIIGHTPEKDAYIGLLAAIDMVISTGRNLGEIKRDVEKLYGVYCPDRDGVVVNLKGDELGKKLDLLKKYKEGISVTVGDETKTIKEVIAIDGRKMIFEDDSWLMIRPSGTEPKVRFYVESRTQDGTGALVGAARGMLKEIGLLND